MTVSSYAGPSQHDCNGILLSFDFDFNIYEESEVKVTVTDADGVDNILTADTEYTVSCVNDDCSNGGTVTVSSVSLVPNGSRITIEMDIDNLQEDDFTEGMGSLYETFEKGLDKRTRKTQQLKNQLDRVLGFPVSDDVDNDLTLPNQTVRANKYFGFDSNGLPVAVNDPATVVDQPWSYIVDATETDQGVTGNGGTLKAYIATIGSTVRFIYFQAGAYTLTTDVTVPANITLRFEPGAVLDGTGTLNLNGQIDAGLYQVFGSSITVIGTDNIKNSYAEWFGADNTGVADSAAAFVAADALGATTVKINDGTYRIDSRVDFTGTNVIGTGSGTVTINAYTLTGFAVTWTSAGGSHQRVGGFKVVSQGATQSGVHIKGGSLLHVYDIYASEFDTTGIQIGDAGSVGVYYSNIERLFVLNIVTQGTTGIIVDGQASPNSNANVFYNCVANRRLTTQWHIKGSSNYFYGGDASWDASGTGVTDVVKIEGIGNVFDGLYIEGVSGLPTRFFNFTSTAYANKFKNLYYSVGNSARNVYSKTLNDGWANSIEFASIGFNFLASASEDNQDNLIPNSHFRQWDASNPDGWTAIYLAVTRESTIVRGAPYSMKMVCTADNPSISCYITGHASSTTPYKIEDFQGKMVRASIWCKTDVAGIGNIKIGSDGTGGAVYGVDVHSGSNEWELLTAMAKIADDATYVQLQVRATETGTTTGTIYFSEPTVAKGNNAPTPQPAAIHDTYAQMMGPFIGNQFLALDDTGTPSVADGNNFETGGTTAITDFINGYEGQEITIYAAHTVTITEGTNIRLSGSTNYVMSSSKTLKLIQRSDGNWYETGRGNN